MPSKCCLKPIDTFRTTYGYDAIGRPIWTRNALGRYDVTHYDIYGRVDWRTQHLSGYGGGTTVPALPPAYRATAPDQNVSTFYGYDGLGRTVLVTQTGILTGTFDPATLRFSTTTERVTRTEYDALSRPVTTTLNYRPGLPATADTNVQTVTYYDGASNPIWQRDALGRWTKTEYDALNRPINTIVNYEDGDPSTGQRDADIVNTTTYDAAGRVAQTVTNAEDGVFFATEPITDRVTLYAYDLLGRTTATIHAYDPYDQTDASVNRRTETAYHPTTGQVLGQRDPLGRWAAQEYDVLGRVTTTIQNCRDASGAPVNSGCAAQTNERNVRSQTRYDGLNRPYETIDPLGGVTHTDYDGLGRVVRTTRNYVAGGIVDAQTNVATTTTYNALGQAVAMTDALSATTLYTYNLLGQTTVVTDATGKVTRSGMDGTGTPRWTQRSDGQISVTFIDGLGRAVTQIANYQDGLVQANEPADQDLTTRTVYDVAGRRIRQIDAQGMVTRFAYNNHDQLTGVEENVRATGCTVAATDCNVLTQYQYDRAGNRTAIIDARGNVRRFAYNAAGEQTASWDALNRVTQMGYDRGGRQITTTDPRGSTYARTFRYDELDRPTGITAGSTTRLSPVSMTYDALGQRKTLVDGTGTTEFGYDPLGRVTQVTAPATGVIGYQYNARGQRTQLTYPGTGAPVIGYTYLPSGQLDLVTQGSTTLADYDYDGLGRVQRIMRANGMQTLYAYDKVDRLRGLRSTVNGAPVTEFQYTLNRAGLRTNVVEVLPVVPTVVPTTRLKTMTFADGSLTHPTTGADSVVGTVSVEQTSPLAGSSSATVNNTVSSYLVESFTAQDTVYLSFLIRLNAVPSSTLIAVQLRSGSTALGNLQITNAGKLRLRNGSTQIGSDSPTLTVGQVYRVGLRQTRQSGSTSNGTLQAFVVAGNSVFGSAFAESSTQAMTSAADTLWMGSINSSGALRLTVDDIALDTAGFAQPENPPTPTPTSAATATPTTVATATPTRAATTTPVPTISATATPTSGPSTEVLRVTLENPSLTDATTGFSATSGTVARTTSAPIKGSASFSIPNNTTGYAQVNFSNQDAVFVTAYLRLVTVPTGGVRVLVISNDNAGSTVSTGNLTFSSGTLRLQNGSTVIGNPSITLQAGTVYRIALVQRKATSGSNGMLEAYLAEGDQPFGAPFARSTTQAITTQAKRVTVGATNGSTLNAVIDDLVIDTGLLPGPSAQGQREQRGFASVAFAPMLQQTSVETRTIAYQYDGLYRLIGAQESGATTQSYSYSYDVVGNRTDGGRQYDAANQVIGWTYDAGGNLLSDGSTTYTYDALSRVASIGGVAQRYNGDGVLVQSGTTRYTQDLVAPLSQILSDGTNAYVYGMSAERVLGQQGSTRTWYDADALGSVRATLNDLGQPQTALRYDPWGVPQTPMTTPFGFTGELQNPTSDLVYLRARWYNASMGRFTSRDPFAGYPNQPYSLHPYQYAYSQPTTLIDPSGEFVTNLNQSKLTITDRFELQDLTKSLLDSNGILPQYENAKRESDKYRLFGSSREGAHI